MDSPLLNHIFRRLFAHETCSALRYTRPRPNRAASLSLVSRWSYNVEQRRARSLRSIFGLEETQSSRYSAPQRKRSTVEEWEQRKHLRRADTKHQFSKAPLVTAEDLKIYTERPKYVKMLMRDFIEDSLYNPNYGYFPKVANIFSLTKPFNFKAMRDNHQYFDELAGCYKVYEDALDEEEDHLTRHLWHTPTEIFRPYYGDALARYMVTNYKLSLYPYYDLIIYELGAGNGTFMLNALDYIAREHPEVYERTQYRIIEVSESMARQQQEKLKLTPEGRQHAHKVQIVKKSIFDWDQYVNSPCFLVALEVFDNFAHDCIAYDRATGAPLQCYVFIDANGDFFDFYDYALDPLAARYLSIRNVACSTTPYPHPLRRGGGGSGSSVPRNLGDTALTWLRDRWNAETLSAPEYIPTRLMQLFDILHNYFPKHRLLASDFHMLPDTVPGVNAPVVQTRYNRKGIAVTTPMVQQGFFDIFFPVNFAVQADMYRAITGKFSTSASHAEFLRRWADIEDTATKSGENPMLFWYQNVSFWMTV